MHNSSKVHTNVVVRILWYLKLAPRKDFMFSKHNHVIVTEYCVSYQSKKDDIKKTRHLLEVIQLFGRVKKNKVVLLSSVETKYRAMAKGI